MDRFAFSQEKPSGHVNGWKQTHYCKLICKRHNAAFRFKGCASLWLIEDGGGLGGLDWGGKGVGMKDIYNSVNRKSHVSLFIHVLALCPGLVPSPFWACFLICKIKCWILTPLTSLWYVLQLLRNNPEMSREGSSSSGSWASQSLRS